MGSNTGETGGGSNDDSSRNNIKSRLDNRFERYLSLRGSGGEESSSNTSKSDIDNINTTTVQQEDDGNWNAVTSPFKSTSKSSSLIFDDKTAESSTSPSVFTNVVRSQTVDRFSNIFMERIGNVMSSGKLSAAWQDGGGSSMISWLLTDYSPEAKDKNNSKAAINPNDYTAERNMMAPYFTPIVWGSSCMVITLLSIRTGRWYQGRQTAINTASRTEYWKGKQYVSNRATTQSIQDVRHTKPLQQTQSNNPLHPRKAYLGSQVKKMASSLNTLPVDLAVSMLVGISTTLFLTRPQELMQDFAKAPLLKGKSVFAEELCTPFSDEMKNINEMTYTYTPYKDSEAQQQQKMIPYSELWKDGNLGEFDSLRAIRDFVHNCHKREELERRKTEKRETIDGSSDEEDDIDHNNVFIC